MFEYTIARDEASALVTIRGELVASVIPELRPALRELVQDASHIVVDCAELTMLDSMGIGMLIAMYNSLTQVQGTLTLRNVSPDVKQLLTTMRLDQRFTVESAE